jgi:hypothetical protein
VEEDFIVVSRMSGIEIDGVVAALTDISIYEFLAPIILARVKTRKTSICVLLSSQKENKKGSAQSFFADVMLVVTNKHIRSFIT